MGKCIHCGKEVTDDPKEALKSLRNQPVVGQSNQAKEPPFRVLPSVKPFNTKFRYYRYLKTLH